MKADAWDTVPDAAVAEGAQTKMQEAFDSPQIATESQVRSHPPSHRGSMEARQASRLAKVSANELPDFVFVVDDDPAVCRTIKELLNSVRLHAELFGSTQEFLEARRPDAPSCLILDVRLPGKSGLDFQGDLAAADISIPIVFITGHGDISMSVRAMKAGAVEFLTKPFRNQDLLDAVHAGLERDRSRRQREAGVAVLRDRFESLTPREREVLPLLISGLLNKQVAGKLGTSEATVKVHRGQLMRKMGAESLPELVRMGEKMGISALNQ
jgi:FixJ family two-component response regulator